MIDRSIDVIECCADERVTVTFLHLDLENSNNCEHDHIKVYDGEDVIGTPRMTLCGSTIPPPITSFGSTLTVRFVSDRSIERTGFQAFYTESSSGSNYPAAAVSRRGGI